jgi:hypothetical protein
MAILAVGMLIGAMALSIALWVTDRGTDEVSAQSDHTWQVHYSGDWPAEDIPHSAFIQQLPADCDLVASPFHEWVMYYSCPKPFTPVNPLD